MERTRKRTCHDSLGLGCLICCCPGTGVSRAQPLPQGLRPLLKAPFVSWTYLDLSRWIFKPFNQTNNGVGAGASGKGTTWGSRFWLMLFHGGAYHYPVPVRGSLLCRARKRARCVLCWCVGGSRIRWILPYSSATSHFCSCYLNPAVGAYYFDRRIVRRSGNEIFPFPSALRARWFCPFQLTGMLTVRVAQRAIDREINSKKKMKKM